MLIDTLEITLVHSTVGLMADVQGLPMQVGPDYVRQTRNLELAEEALKARYPELVVVASAAQGETGFFLWVERV